MAGTGVGTVVVPGGGVAGVMVVRTQVVPCGTPPGSVPGSHLVVFPL